MILLPCIAVSAAAFVAATLSFYSGFGLGTLLLPVFAIFFPPEMAVAATAVVHCSNSVFKAVAAGRHAERALVLSFGLPAIAAAIVGAWLLGRVSELPTLARYRLGGIPAEITPLTLTLGAMMLAFALLELLPALRHIHFPRRYMAIGGLLSGFFGGFSGHQGALRSAFLVKADISTEAFVGTNAVISLMVDLMRLAVYAWAFVIGKSVTAATGNEAPLILTGVAAALAGVVAGRRFLKKVTIGAVQTLTGVLLLIIALIMLSGLLMGSRVHDRKRPRPDAGAVPPAAGTLDADQSLRRLASEHCS